MSELFLRFRQAFDQVSYVRNEALIRHVNAYTHTSLRACMFEQKCKIPVRPHAILTATMHDPLAIPHIDPTIPVNVGVP